MITYRAQLLSNRSCTVEKFHGQLNCFWYNMLPIFIVHFCLPKAHGQAPISGSIILAGLLLKIGGD